MLNDVSSRHLRNASELLVLAPIKQGFVPIADTVSYVTRLRSLLGALYELRRVLAERELAWVAGPIEKLQSIFNSQWTVLPGNRHLLVTVTFDRSWEEYFQFLVRHAGPALDLIFTHCEGYADHACRKDGVFQYQAFAEFIRRHQIHCDFYYATMPDLTVDDVTYLKKLAAQRAPSVNGVAAVRIMDAQTEIESPRKAAALQAVLAENPGLAPDQQAAAVAARLAPALAAKVRELVPGFYDLRTRYFPDVCEPDGPDQLADARRGASARAIFDAAIVNLVPDLAYVPESDAATTQLDAWIASLARDAKALVHETACAAPPDPVQLSAEQLGDIQGNVLTSYQDMTDGCAVMLRCDGPEAARALLERIAPEVTSHEGALGGGPFVNLAVTYGGLRRLGLPDDVLSRFPKEFREGMEQRAGALGDVGAPNHPDHWQLPRANFRDGDLVADEAAERVALSGVDFVVTLQTGRPLDAGQEWARHPLRERVIDLDRDGSHVLHVQLLRRHTLPPREHFGFQDGGSQPVPDVVLPDGARLGANKLERDLVPLGELLLGHRDARGEIAFCADPERNPDSAALFVNGSFLVIRKLEQDVGAFKEFARTRAGALGHPGRNDVNADKVKEWMLGRKVAGGPLLPLIGSCEREDLNDFQYAPLESRDGGRYEGDPDGQKCPFHAHVRRANPRVTDTYGRGVLPRIMRRGFSYGRPHDQAPDDTERGLLFMAYNASIASQFEVVQRWLNGGNVTGVLSAQNDLFSGAPQPAATPHWVHDGRNWVALASPERPLVSLRWGLYLFAPSKSGLSWLRRAAERASHAPAAALRDPDLVRAGRELIARLQGVEAQQGESAARRAWKSVIEEPPNAGMAAAVWSAIRADGGTLATAYGVLVAGAQGAAQVLDGGLGRAFSVREYWHRLRATIGEHYLSFDPDPHALTATDPSAQAKHAEYEARMADADGKYAEVARAPNRYIVDAMNDGDAVFEEARRETRALLDLMLAGDPRAEVNVQAAATVVVARLSRTWFGLPAVPEPPEKADRAEALGARAAENTHLAAELNRFVLASKFSFQPHPEPALTAAAAAQGAPVRAGACPMDSAFSRALDGAGYAKDAAARALAGSVVGFAAPAIGCIAAVMHQWIESRELFRLAESLRLRPTPEALRHAVLAALARTPIPPLLYRTAMPGARIAGAPPIEPGSPVIVGLGSAYADSDDWNWLFGGTRDVNPHACPAREAALGVVMGVAAALLERPGLRRKRPLVLAYA